MFFEDLPVSKIQAQLSGFTTTITIAGVTVSPVTPAEAKLQIDKILDIVGRSVVTYKMKQILSREAVEE